MNQIHCPWLSVTTCSRSRSKGTPSPWSVQPFIRACQWAKGTGDNDQPHAGNDRWSSASTHLPRTRPRATLTMGGYGHLHGVLGHPIINETQGIRTRAVTSRGSAGTPDLARRPMSSAQSLEELRDDGKRRLRRIKHQRRHERLAATSQWYPCGFFWGAKTQRETQSNDKAISAAR